MAELPTGTVTFLFTDVEGSTRLLHELGAGYAGVLAEHRAALRDAFARHGGVEVDTQGDAFFVAFSKASEALAAAADARDALRAGPVRVRMGLHTGEPFVTAEGYVGVDVHRAARIAAAGHGGQILVSQPTRDLAGSDGLRYLGRHRLKDLAGPERIYQFGDDDFPPLKSLNTSNLPTQSTELVGREREVADVVTLVRSTRVVTLTGIGGSGKTRVALHAAAELLEDFPDGVWFVSLAAVRDGRLLEPTIAEVIGASGDLAEWLRQKRMLLLLDNLEQLLPTAATVVASLEAHVLATSRERLNLSGEYEYPVPPLAVPDAVALFERRARQFKPGFEADDDVAEVVRKLDGLPLAIELAAARIKILTTRQIADRVAQSLDLLTGGTRDAPDRQRTLRATVDWSYRLLVDDEQRLFLHLAVFAGGFDLDAAERVSGAALDDLQALVDKSLIRQTESGRFFMLQTIREFALEQLRSTADEDETKARHAAHYADVVSAPGPLLELGPAAPDVLNQFELEHNNVRAALAYLSETADGQTLARIVCRFWPFWWLRVHLDEGRRWLDTALTYLEPATDLHFAALEGAAHLAHVQGDQARAHELAEVFLRTARGSGDDRGVGIALHLMANAAIASGAIEQGMALDEESLEHLDARDRYSRYPRSGLGYLAILAGDYERGAELIAEVLEFDREVGDVEGVANDLGLLAIAAAQIGQESEAIRLIRECATVAAELGHTQVLGNRVLPAAALIFARRGDASRAVAVLSAARRAARARGGDHGGDHGLGPLGDAVHQQVWQATAPTLEPGLVSSGKSGAHDLELDSFVDETLRALD